jgi:hypothetical protein
MVVSKSRRCTGVMLRAAVGGAPPLREEVVCQ